MSRVSGSEGDGFVCVGVCLCGMCAGVSVGVYRVCECGCVGCVCVFQGINIISD